MFDVSKKLKYLKISKRELKWFLCCRLFGLFFFMGDSDVEILFNVTRGDYDFDDEAFDEILDLVKDFINKIIKFNKK